MGGILTLCLLTATVVFLLLDGATTIGAIIRLAALFVVLAEANEVPRFLVVVIKLGADGGATT